MAESTALRAAVSASRFLVATATFSQRVRVPAAPGMVRRIAAEIVAQPGVQISRQAALHRRDHRFVALNLIQK